MALIGSMMLLVGLLSLNPAAGREKPWWAPLLILFGVLAMIAG